MNVRQALYIRTIAEEKGVTAAAKKLHISQPSLSQMLRQIEEEAGTPLFERGTQVFHPTYAGERYLHAAEVILNTNEILENELREIRGEERGRLRLGISVQRSIQLLPKVLPEFTRLYPKVEFRLREAGSAHLEQMVQSGQVDLALASVEPASPQLEYRLIHRERIGILTGPGSPLAQRVPSGSSIPLSEAMDAPLCDAAVRTQRPDRPGASVPGAGSAPTGLSGDGHHGGGPTDRGPVQLLYGVRGQLSAQRSVLLSPGGL